MTDAHTLPSLPCPHRRPFRTTRSQALLQSTCHPPVTHQRTTYNPPATHLPPTCPTCHLPATPLPPTCHPPATHL
eukprot:356150-Chlamydomonas_euryale.AAC.3